VVFAKMDNKHDDVEDLIFLRKGDGSKRVGQWLECKNVKDFHKHMQLQCSPSEKLLATEFVYGKV